MYYGWIPLYTWNVSPTGSLYLRMLGVLFELLALSQPEVELPEGAYVVEKERSQTGSKV